MEPKKVLRVHWLEEPTLAPFRGRTFMDTGYIYAPYVPLQLTPTMYNPFNFVPVKGIMTRYAKKMVNNRFYETIDVMNLPTTDET